MKKRYRLKFDAKAKAVKAKIQSTSGGDQFKNLDQWVAFYKEHARLPSTKILCSNCKKKPTSMFGDNLKRTLPKFGSIEKLLTQFECSACRKAKAPAKNVVNTKVRKNKEVGSINAENKGDEYLTREQMEDRKEKVRASLPKMDPDYKPTPMSFSNAEDVAELTRGSCQRPDIYLDAGCVHCPLYKHCVCASKNDKDLLKDGKTNRRRK